MPLNDHRLSRSTKTITTSQLTDEKKTPVCTAIALLTLFVGAGLSAQSPKSDSLPNPPQAWQHLAMEHEGATITDTPDLARKINRLGDEGWQLVDVESISEGGTTTKMICFFKRLKQP